MTFIDPGDQPRGKTRKPDVRAPDAPNLFDISNQPPDTPLQVKSATSIDTAKETNERTMSRRREMVLHLLQNTKPGLARFQIAQRLGMPDHWITSTVDALVKMVEIEEHETLTVINPKSGRSCAVLVVIDKAEASAA